MVPFRFVDDQGNRYMPVREIYGPYGSAHIFTGPKVYWKLVHNTQNLAVVI